MARAPVKKTESPESDSALPLPERYEEALSELETLVARMEAGALPLDQLLGHYQRGAQLLQFCVAAYLGNLTLSVLVPSAL